MRFQENAYLGAYFDLGGYTRLAQLALQSIICFSYIFTTTQIKDGLKQIHMY